MDLLLVGCTGISLRTHTRIVPDTCTYIVPDIQYPLCPIYVFKKLCIPLPVPVPISGTIPYPYPCNFRLLMMKVWNFMICN